MFNYFRKELDWGGRKLVLETGKIARQADGAVMISYGDTIVLCTAVGVRSAKPGQDFFPLTVNYQEKTFAAGRIPGGFFKREGRPSERETLISRLIDRPIRPLFPDGFANEVQVVATVLSLNPDIDADIPALLGASAALMIAGLPFNGPAVLMVESEAKILSEDAMLGAVVFGHEQMQVAIKAIRELTAEAGKPRWDWKPALAHAPLVQAVAASATAAVSDAYRITEKQQRSNRLSDIKKE